MEDDDDARMLKKIWGKFEGTEVFQLSHFCSKTLLHTIDFFNLSQIRWKSLVLSLDVACDTCVLRFCELMRGLKHLENLIIYAIEFPPYTKFGTNFPLVELSSPGVMPKLKTVTLHNYVKPLNRQLQVVEFFLKSAAVLDKLLIVPNQRQLTGAEELEFVKRASSFQRSSPAPAYSLLEKYSMWWLSVGFDSSGCFSPPYPYPFRKHGIVFV